MPNPTQTGSATSAADAITRALFRDVTNGNASGTAIPVHFNPDSLEYQLQNNVDRRGNSNSHKQYISESTGKLTMQLVFDTTVSGKDVRRDTEKLQALMKPRPEGSRRVAHVAQFEWGAFRFVGTFDSYKETLDYFSSTGVPLRATVQLTMAQQEGVFEPTAHGRNPTTRGTLQLSPVPGQSIDEAGISRDDAARNGEENLRSLSGQALVLDAGVSLRAPSAFASGSFGVSLSAGINAELGIGVSLGAAAGFGLDLGAGAGIDIGLDFGVSADIGVSVNANLDLSGSSRAAAASQLSAQALGAASSLQQTAARAAAVGVSTPQGARAGSNGLLAANGAPSAANGSRRTSLQPSAAKRAFPTPANGAGPTLSGPTWGGRAAAGMPARFGAFAGLSPAPSEPRRNSTPQRRPAERTANSQRSVHTGDDATFDVGGRVLDHGAPSLAADVGARASLIDRVRLQFDEE